MKSLRRLFVYMTAIAFSAVSLQGADYFVSPDGDDDAAGDHDNPWRTIDHANARVAPGDTVTFLPGDYEGTIAPQVSGREGAPVTFRSEKPWEAVLRPEGRGFAVDLQEARHVGVEGFMIDGRGEGGWVRARDSGYLTLRGNRMVDAGPVTDLLGCRHVKILDNVFSKDRVTGNMVQVRESEHVLIEGNSFTRVGHNPLLVSVCRYVVVRGNLFHNDWGRNFEFWATTRILIEGNIVTEARDSAYSADSRAKNLYHEGIFRFNRVFRNRHTPLNSGSYMPVGAGPTHHFREPFRMVNSRVYHNTIADNLGFGWELWGMNVSSTLFQNNIFAGNDWAGGHVQLIWNEEVAGDNRLRNNLLRGTDSGQTVVRYRGDHLTAAEADERTPLQRGFWSEFDGTLDADPGFVDRDRLDYRLEPDSAARDAGLPLTVALGSGRGRVLPVADGVFFFDGFGIEGERGDWIAVGEGTRLARIEKVELRGYLPARLHLDREVAWEEGDPVGLPWSGDAPDMGAYEHGDPNPARVVVRADNPRPEPDEPVRFALSAADRDGIERVYWNFGDGSGSEDREPEHAYTEAGHYRATVRVVFADGSRAIDVVFIDVAEAREPGDPLVRADFEDETRDTEWGYHFKFYRGWLTGFAHEERADGRGKAKRLYFDPNKANRAAAAIAPGAWVINEYPRLRLAYRIRPGTPVALVVEPFEAPGRPRGFILGGTENRTNEPYIDLDAYSLVDDGEWHEIEMDLRRVREAHPELDHLYRFMFYTRWDEDEDQEFWFDDFYILPPEQSD